MLLNVCLWVWTKFHWILFKFCLYSVSILLNKIKEGFIVIIGTFMKCFVHFWVNLRSDLREFGSLETKSWTFLVLKEKFLRVLFTSSAIFLSVFVQ